MLVLAVLVASTQPVAGLVVRPVAPRVEAQATVRILQSVSLRVGDSKTLEGKRLRSTWVRTAAGQLVPAKLAEFE